MSDSDEVATIAGHETGRITGHQVGSLYDPWRISDVREPVTSDVREILEGGLNS